ncbi:MAG: hypothetical protein WC135_02725 [Bacteroidales bacterium]
MHLVSLGLIYKSKSVRVYVDYYQSNFLYDEDKKSYYYDRYSTIDLTDQEYNELCEFHPPT